MSAYKKNVDELVLSVHAAIRHSRYLAFNPLEETIGFYIFTIMLLNRQVKRTVVQRWRGVMCSEWIDEGDRGEWVILNVESGRRSDCAKLDRDEETEGWPIVIAGINNFLVFSHSVHLDVSDVVANVVSAFPCYDVLDVGAVKSTKNDDVSSTNWASIPDDWVDVDAIVNSSKHSFR